MRAVGIPVLVVGLLVVGLAGGCATCEEDIDCVILCDCDGDGAGDSFFAHDCKGGVCINGYDRDLRVGCETLCSEEPFE